MIKISSSCVIETPRLILRAPQIGDGLIINESINKSIMHLKMDDMGTTTSNLRRI